MSNLSETSKLPQLKPLSPNKEKIDLAILQAQNPEIMRILSAGIVHDFNNLLAAIFGNIDVAQEYLAQGDIKNAAIKLAKAMENFDRAKNLTQQLMTFDKR